MTQAAQDDRPEPDETDLIRRIKAGDRGAFTVFVDRHLVRVFRFSYSILKDYAAAQDITQEAYLRLWQNAHTLDENGRVHGFILRIAHNLCIDEIRRRRPTYDIDDPECVLPAHEAGQDTDVHEERKARILEQALFKLPDRQRTAMMLVYYNDLSNIEAARIMDISVDALESLLSRGKKGLRGLLGDQRQELMEG